MKPLMNSPGPSPSPADQAENTSRDRRPPLQPPLPARTLSGPASSRTRSHGTARLEDIVGVVPKSVRPVVSEPTLTETFYRDLEEQVGAAASINAALTAAAELLRSHAGFEFTGYYTRSTAVIGQPVEVTGLAPQISELPESSQAKLTALTESLQTGQQGLQTRPLPAGVFVKPVPNSHTVLVAFVAGESNTAQRSAVEVVAAQMAAWSLRAGLRESESDVRHVAAIVELVSHISSCTTIKDAAQRIADELADYLSATRVFVGHCPTARTACRLVQMSGGEFDPLAEATVQAEAVLQESLARNALSVWPCHDAGGRHALLAHQRFAENNGAAVLVACPLTTESGDAVGSLLVAWESADSSAIDATKKFLSAVARPLSVAVQSVSTSSQSLPARLRHRTRSVLRGHRLTACAAFVAAVTGLCLVPVEYRVRCDSELQPVLRRFVAAPFAAPLDECLAQPGDVVEADQVLARLDGRELRWELAGLQADLGKATNEHNTHLSERKSGEAAIARHEMARLGNRAALLQDRTRNLEIRSPIAGIVVAGDLRETEGVPLETGQSLFEIAPLDRMTIEVALPEEDIRHVRAGMPVSLILDAMPAETIAASIRRIHPRAELRDHENVFIADAEIRNEDLRLRPGMKGSAKIDTGTRALGWTLFHKPIAHVIGWMGW